MYTYIHVQNESCISISIWVVSYICLFVCRCIRLQLYVAVAVFVFKFKLLFMCDCCYFKPLLIVVKRFISLLHWIYSFYLLVLWLFCSVLFCSVRNCSVCMVPWFLLLILSLLLLLACSSPLSTATAVIQ